MNLTWSLQIGRQQLKSNSKQLCALPQTLSSVSSVRLSVKGLESMQFCTGNEDSKYFPVQAARKGIFKNPSGELHVIYKFCV